MNSNVANYGISKTSKMSDNHITSQLFEGEAHERELSSLRDWFNSAADQDMRATSPHAKLRLVQPSYPKLSLPNIAPLESSNNQKIATEPSDKKNLQKSQEEINDLIWKNMPFYWRCLDKFRAAWNPYLVRKPSLSALKSSKIPLEELPFYGYTDWESLLEAGLNKSFLTRECWFDPDKLASLYAVTGRSLWRTLGLTAQDMANMGTTLEELVNLKLSARNLREMGMDSLCFHKFGFTDSQWVNTLLLDYRELYDLKAVARDSHGSYNIFPDHHNKKSSVHTTIHTQPTSAATGGEIIKSNYQGGAQLSLW